jgi:hypothetical protein
MTTKGKRIKKTVAYKHAQFNSKPKGESLKSLMDKAINALKTVGARRRPMSADPNAPVFHLLGSTKSEKNGFLFGSLLAYSPGVDAMFLVEDAAASDVKLETLKAPKTKDGKQRELLESVMFFGILDDHLVLLQSQVLKSAQAESYFQWLLHQAKTLTGDNTVTLLDTPSASIRKKIEQAKGVRGIKFGGEVLPVSVMPKHETPSLDLEHETPKDKMKDNVSVSALSTEATGGLMSAIKSLIKPADYAKINFDDLLGSNIELTLMLRYKTKTTEQGHKLMNSLGAALRNTEDLDTELQLIGGGTIKGTDLKLNGEIGLTSYNGQLSESEVYEAMRGWLLSKIKTQDVKT